MAQHAALRRRAAITGLFVANGIEFGNWVGNLPRLREGAGLDEPALGLVLFAAALGAVGAMPLAGIAAVKFGPARTSVIAAALLALATPLPSLLPAGPALLASAALLGVLSGSMDVAMNARGSELEAERGRPMMSSFHAGWSAGGLLGAALASLMAAASIRLPLAVAAAALVSVVFAAPGLRLTDRPSTPGARRFAWPSRTLLGVGLLACLCFTVEGAVADWGGVYLRSILRASTATAAASYALFSGAMVAGRLAGDSVVRRFGPIQVVRGGALLAAIGLGVALLVPLTVVAMAGFALVGLGVANMSPVMFSAAGRRGGAPAVAMAATAGYGGLMGSPPAIGVLAAAIRLPGALGCVLLLAVLTALIAPVAGARPAMPVSV